jgi:TrmH family RNA methyltransferase
MLSINQLKLINSLHSKKGRAENKQFLVEGEKGISEILNSNFEVSFIVLNSKAVFKDIELARLKNTLLFYVDESALIKLSSLTTNTFGLAVVHFSTNNHYEEEKDNYTLILDGIRDPGNLGTIIRICDWYGINQIVLSEDSTEIYNPKVISATMGSFKRIRFFYTDLKKFLENKKGIPVLGAFLNGENIHETPFPKGGFLILGNESVGIREENLTFIDRKITIPRFGQAESLNVAISTGIILDNLKRK